MKSAVLFLVFNRPEKTKKVFEAIRKAKPPKLYIAADGARNGKQGERERCERVRNIFQGIDWKCEVKTLYRDNNLGCKLAISSAITWFFEGEQEGVILEDDCVPGESFFQFMDEMLERYRYEVEVACINGSSIMGSIQSQAYSYHFTVNPFIWGWGTWRRVWQLYDIEMKAWPNFLIENKITEIYYDKKQQRKWIYYFQQTYDGVIPTWDFQFVFTVLKNKLLCVQPYKNLISNIGFDEEATLTKDKASERSNQEIVELEFPLKHPPIIEREYLIEQWEYRNNRTSLALLRILRKAINIKLLRSNLEKLLLLSKYYIWKK